MTAIPAHDLLRTRICTYRGCAKDAEHDSAQYGPEGTEQAT